jgi:tetratricopeptide (TPR) repeat protein
MNKLQHNATLLASRVALCCSLLIPFFARKASAQTISPEARRHFAAARQAQDANALDQAAEEYKATIRLAPTFAGAYSNLGLIFYVQGSFKDSATALAKGLHLDPKLLGANLYLGIDYLKLNHPDKALPFLQHAAQLDPSNKDAQSWLGTAYWEAGQTWAALEQLREADKNFPNDPDILFVLGEAYRKTADQEMQTVITHASGTAYVHQIFGDIYLDQYALAKAAGHFQRALQQDPKTPNIHFELGEAALFAGHPDEAEIEYRKQLDLTPSSAAAKARLAELALLKLQIPAALSLFDEALTVSPLETVSALQLPPSFANASQTFPDKLLDQLRAAAPALEQSPDTAARNLALATIFARTGQFDAFQTTFTQFESTIPHQAAAPDLRARATQDFERQNFEEAESEIHTWLKTHPQDLPAQYLAARAHRLLSLGVLDKLLTAYPDSYRSHQLLAQTYEQRDEDDKAAAEYKKVEELSPTLPGVHYALGHLLVKDGDLEQATVQLKEELRLDPNHPEANAEMGMALLSQNQAPAAIEYLTKAIALQPDLWTAHEQLGKALYLAKNYEGARKELTLALTDDPEGVAHYQLGLVYKALGQTEDAKREFASSRKIKSDRLAKVEIEMPDAKPGASNE